MDEMLGWAAVECSRPVSKDPRYKPAVNNYEIALDFSCADGQRFVCPCCGDTLSLKVKPKNFLTADQRRKIIALRHKDSWDAMAIFAALSLVIIAGVAACFFIEATALKAVRAVVAISAAVIWLPYFIYMITRSRLFSNERGIIERFEKKYGPGGSLKTVDGGAGAIHEVKRLPQVSSEEEESGIGIGTPSAYLKI